MPDDLRADIMAAMTSVEAGETGAPLESADNIIPEAEDTGLPPIDGADNTPQPGDKARDEAGKFKAKPKEAAPEKVTDKPKEEASAKVPEGKQEAAKSGEEIQPPKGWRGGAKVAWNKLPAPVRDEILAEHKRVADQETKYAGIAQAIEPRRSALTVAYGSPENAVQQLFGAWDALNTDPKGFVLAVAQQRGIDLRSLIPQGAQQHPQMQPSSDPTVQGLQQQVAQLTNQLSQVVTQSRQSADAPYISQVEAFSADAVNHPYFNEVREDMSLLMANGRAKTLQDAYDAACHMRPDIRAQIQLQESERAEAARRQKTAQATAAASTVSGSPLANAANDTPAPATIREALQNAIQQHGGLRV